MSTTDFPGLVAVDEIQEPTSTRAGRMDRTLETIRKHLGMEVAYLSEFVDGQSVFRAVDAPGFEELAHVGSSYALEDVYCKHICEGRLPELIPDTAANDFALAIPMTKALPIGSHMSLPIKRPDGSLYGMFCCLSSKPNTTLNERDLNTMRVFADLATEQIHDELNQEDDFRNTKKRIENIIENSSFRCVYQPIWNLVEGVPAGFEALCRFDAEPYRAPDIWFNEAADCGMGEELELAVIAQAVKAFEDLPDNCYVSINVSPGTVLSGGLAKVVDHLPLNRLVIEVTEHAVVVDYQGLAEALAPLRSAGARLAVDDAGAGYSSLKHIVMLKPDIIKLDMSLTRSIDSDQALRALANALIHFSRETGAAIVAEGIETEAEHKMLKMLGVYGGQGYHLGRPGDLTSVLELIGSSKKAEAKAA